MLSIPDRRATAALASLEQHDQAAAEESVQPSWVNSSNSRRALPDIVVARGELHYSVDDIFNRAYATWPDTTGSSLIVLTQRVHTWTPLAMRSWKVGFTPPKTKA